MDPGKKVTLVGLPFDRLEMTLPVNLGVPEAISFSYSVGQSSPPNPQIERAPHGHRYRAEFALESVDGDTAIYRCTANIVASYGATGDARPSAPQS